MHRKELNERSPLRVLESSIHGGLGRGNLGIVVARHGVGKTAFLVGVALDDLLRGRSVLHVSLEDSVDRIVAFYDEVFSDLARTQELEDVWRARRELERHRRIQRYRASEFSAQKLNDTLDFWIQAGDFRPSAILIEGFDFASVEPATLAALKEIARAHDAELWMSAHTSRDAARNERGVPEPVASIEQLADVILTMGHDGHAVHIGLQKDHDNESVSELKLALDPTTLLVIRE